MDPSLALVSVVGLIAACALVLLFGRKINVLFLLAGLFLVISPFSAAALKLVTLSKWARVLTTLLIVATAVLRLRITRFGPAVWAVLPFVFLHQVSATWGYYSLNGFFYKGIFTLTFLSGIFLAYAVRDREELIRGLHFLVILAAVGAAATLVFARPAGGSFEQQRLDTLEINPNRIAGNCASMLLLSSFLALYGRSARWRAFGWLVCAMLAAIVVLTGSRSGAAVVAVGFLVQSLPLTMRPGRLLTLVLIVAAMAFGAIYYLAGSVGASRLFSLVDTRAIQWKGNLRVFYSAPVIGHGWIFSPDLQRGNVHSMYFQIACEMGIVGLGSFFLSSLLFVRAAVRNHRFLREHHADTDLTWFSSSLIIAILFMGLVESSPLMGTTPDTLLLGFAIGLIDQIPRLLMAERRKALLRARYAPPPASGRRLHPPG